jgi:hypothetical protein
LTADENTKGSGLNGDVSITQIQSQDETKVKYFEGKYILRKI